MRKLGIALFLGWFGMSTAQESTDWRSLAASYLELAQSSDEWYQFESGDKGRELLQVLRTNPDFSALPEFALLESYWVAPLTMRSIEQLEPLLENSNQEEQVALLLEMGKVYPSGPDRNAYLDRALAIADENQFQKIDLLLEYAYWQSGYQSLQWVDAALALLQQDKALSDRYFASCARTKANILYRVGELEGANEWELRARQTELEVEAFRNLETRVFNYSNPEPDYSQHPSLLVATMLQTTGGTYGYLQSARLYAEFLRNMPESIEAAKIAYQAARSYYMGGKPELAVPLFEKAVTQFTELRTITDHTAWAINGTMMLGVAYFQFGADAQAYDRFKELDDLLRKIGWERSENRFATVHNLLLTSFALADDSLIRVHSEAFAELERSGTSDADARRLYTYGIINAALGNNETAFNLLKKCYDEHWSMVTFDQMHRQWENENDPDYDAEFWENLVGEEDVTLQIEPDYDAYLQRPKPTDATYVPLLKQLALVAFQVGNMEEAQRYIIEYVNEYYTALVWRHQHGQTGSDLSEIYQLKEDLFPMYDLYLLALVALEKKNGVLPEERKRAFNQTMDGKSNLQYEYRHIRQSIEQADDPELRALYQTYLQLREAWGASARDGQSVDSLQIAVNSARIELSQRSAKFKAGESRFVFWTDVKKRLGKKEALVEIRRIADPASDQVYYVAFVLKARDEYPAMVVFEAGKAMETTHFMRYQNSIKYKIDDKTSYPVFWAPLQAHLRKIKTVYLAPDGIFSRISINGLRNPEDEKYVGDQLNVQLVVSAKQLTLPPNEEQPLQKAVLMGRPKYHIDDWAPELELGEMERERALTRDQIANGEIADLPGTEVEVTNIAALLGKAGIETTTYLHEVSSEVNFKEAEGNILHVATHGFWFEVPEGQELDPMLHSGLLFSGVKNHLKAGSSATNDGILTAYEIQGMSMDHTQLVVLSACETGLGKVEIGEGVFGLQRAFAIAGVDKLIMSLWKVDDEATQQLFSAFYKNWLQDGMAIPAAFSQAQRTLRARYPHPYYWAAFVLVD